MRRIVLLGAPASGKGTQAARIASHFQLPNLSTGALIRAEQQQGTNLGRLADQFLTGGGFLPDDLMCEIMTSWLETKGDGGFVLDGFPRTLPQATLFKDLLNLSGQRLDAVILLKVDLQTLHDRITSRVHCGRCGGTFQSVDGLVGIGRRCPQDNCVGMLAKRSDDEPATYAGRLANFHQLTAPLIELYENDGILKQVDGSLTSESVFDEILDQLGVSSGVKNN